MNIANILAGLEKLVVELLLWLLFIPRTMLRIVSEPGWVPVYVDTELAKDRDRFADYMSPIPLFLICSVVLFIILDTVVFGGSAVGDAKLGKAIEALKGERGTVVALGFLCLPLLFSLGTELFRERSLNRSGIERMLYIQCFYFAPLTLSSLGIALYEESPIIQGLLGLLLLLSLIWFLIVEVKLIAIERQIGALKAVAVFLACSAAVLSLGVIALLLTETDVSADAAAAGNAEIIETTLPHDGTYQVVVAGYEESAGKYTLELLNNDESVTCTMPQQIVTAGQETACSFSGSAGDSITVTVRPIDEDFDVMLDLRHQGASLTSASMGPELLDLLGVLYVFAIGLALFRGLWSSLRRAPN
jgi:hypothetical protein